MHFLSNLSKIIPSQKTIDIILVKKSKKLAKIVKIEQQVKVHIFRET